MTVRSNGRRLAVLPALVAFIVCASLASSALGAQDDPRPRSLWRPLLGGGVAGLALAVSYIQQPGEAWLVDDETALPIAMAAGLASAFIVRAHSSDLRPTEARRPRLRITAGGGAGMDWDLSLGYRAPAGQRFALEGTVLVVNETWELIETETRCSDFFGCITGQFLTDYRYEQAVGFLGRGVYELRSRESLTSTFALAAGPMLVHVDREGAPAARRAAMLLEGVVGIESGVRTRWIVEGGYRYVGGGDAGESYGGGWSLRSGVALAY